MLLSELARCAVETFERGNIPGLVTGSIAAMTYGEPRLTSGAEIDRSYLERWATILGLSEIWKAIQERPET